MEISKLLKIKEWLDIILASMFFFFTLPAIMLFALKDERQKRKPIPKEKKKKKAVKNE